MNELSSIRKNLLRLMYLITIIVAGVFGITLINKGEYLPMRWLVSTAVGTGLYASVLLAFAACGLLGLFYPEKFIGILVLQLLYKSIWLTAVVLPNRMNVEQNNGLSIIVTVFLFFIIGDLFVIPFLYLFGRKSGNKTKSINKNYI